MAKASAKAVDFSGVKDRGNFNPRRVTEGDYAAIITAVEDGESKKDPGAFQYIFTIKLQKFSQNAYPYYCKLQENQLWKLRNLAMAAGLNVPKARTKFDPNKLVGKLIGVTMADDEYDGKPKSVVDAVFPAAELSDGGEDIPDADEDFDEGTDATPVAATDDADEAEVTEKPKKKKKEKGKKKKGSEENLEELDISEIG